MESRGSEQQVGAKSPHKIIENKGGINRIIELIKDNRADTRYNRKCRIRENIKGKMVCNPLHKNTSYSL